MKLRAAIFDWAGTMVDFGSCAPVIAMNEVFRQAGIAIGESLIRRFMGMAKREHLVAILSNSEMRARWRRAHDADWTETDIDKLMLALEPAMREAAAANAELVPGAAAAAHALRDRDLRIGSTTGYTRTMMADILKEAALQGYEPDVVVCAGETAQGRPAPLMIWKCLVEMGVWPAAAAVVADDAPVGVEAGRHAGCWTVGLAASGNGVGLSYAAYTELTQAERKARMLPAIEDFKAAGADFVVESVADLSTVTDEIDRRLADGQRPDNQPVWLADAMRAEA